MIIVGNLAKMLVVRQPQVKKEDTAKCEKTRKRVLRDYEDDAPETSDDEDAKMQPAATKHKKKARKLSSKGERTHNKALNALSTDFKDAECRQYPKMKFIAMAVAVADLSMDEQIAYCKRQDLSAAGTLKLLRLSASVKKVTASTAS
jgi:hypothetical protein